MNEQSDDEMINSIIGLGEKSIRKSYYPQLKKKLEEIEELNQSLEQKVTDRTKELEEQKNIFETLFNDVSDAIALIKNGRFIDCNKAVLDLLEYTDKDSFLHVQPHEISPQNQPDGISSREKEIILIERCLKEGKIKFEWVHKKSTGELFWVDVSLTKIRLNNEDIVHVVWRDITDKKHLEEQIQLKNAQLQESNDELHATIENLKRTQKKLVESEKIAGLAEVVNRISKEINNPTDIAATTLSFLIHTIESAKESNENKPLTQEELNEFFNLSKELSDTVNINLKSIVKLIRYFQQTKVEKNEFLKRNFNIKEFVHGIILSKEEELEANDIEVELFCDENLELNTTADDFQKIVTVLIANSIKHAFQSIKSNKKISIEIMINDNKLYLIYKDNGIGIPKEHLDKIFEPFFTTSNQKSDYGLGLSIIYNTITSKFNGFIKCKSKEKGVLFSVTLPLQFLAKEKVYTTL